MDTLQEKLNKVLIKDFKLPIPVYKEPYFKYFIELYNHKDIIELQNDAVRYLGSPDKFLSYRKTIAEVFWSRIKQDAIDSFRNSDIKCYSVDKAAHRLVDANLYSDTYTDIDVCKIDMISANFQAIKHHDNRLVDNCESYNELIGKITDIPYFKKSKYTRQVIFGQLLPKRQGTIQKYLMQQFIDFCISDNTENSEHFKNNARILGNDEIFTTVLNPDFNDFVIDKVQKFREEYNIALRVDFIKLHKFKGYFVEENTLTHEKTLKTVPVDYYAQLYKTLNNRLITIYDLITTKDNQAVLQLQPIVLVPVEVQNKILL